ncbi:hypothetical protein J4450_07650 [Candidatus Micrarchaeota archaeon]|nr:hypothetical protein [Candidatus Micrarchaeota archaeon]
MDSAQQFLEIENENKGRAKIIIDHRESENFDEMFKQAGAVAERTQLEIGDFICSARCIIERKTRDDFEASIIDGRLFTQLFNLVSNYERVIIIVEGESNAERLRKESLLGAYATIITDFGAALFFTRNMEKTAEMIYAIAKHEQLAKKQPLRIYAKRKTLTISQNQRAIIEMFPMIGPKKAKQLLEHFGNIENIVKASERELKEVEGMGEKRAKVIRRIVEEKYNKEEDSFDMI